MKKRPMTTAGVRVRTLMADTSLQDRRMGSPTTVAGSACDIKDLRPTFGSMFFAYRSKFQPHSSACCPYLPTASAAACLSGLAEAHGPGRQYGLTAAALSVLPPHSAIARSAVPSALVPSALPSDRAPAQTWQTIRPGAPQHTCRQ